MKARRDLDQATLSATLIAIVSIRSYHLQNIVRERREIAWCPLHLQTHRGTRHVRSAFHANVSATGGRCLSEKRGNFLKGKWQATETPEDIEFYGRQNNITCIQQALTVNYIYPSFMATFIFRDLSSCTLQPLRALCFSVCSNNIHFSHGPCTIWMTLRLLKHSEGHHTYTRCPRGALGLFGQLNSDALSDIINFV